MSLQSSDLTADLTKDLTEQVRAAAAARRPLAIRGGGTKSFLGRETGSETPSEPLEIGGHAGILNYQPEELVITARSGTTLEAVEQRPGGAGPAAPLRAAALRSRRDPGGHHRLRPLGSGQRPYAGAARDLVLGARVLTGRAEVLRFGGEVMKNVAGYDVSRLMAGAYGTLGVLLDLSLKVLPVPAVTRTRVQVCGESEALGA